MSNRKPGQFRLRTLAGEDKARLVSYLFAVVWPIVFMVVQPPSYSVISDLIMHIWMVISTVGGIGAIVGVLSGIDLKIELPSLYFVILGPFLYFIAQVGFIFAGDVQTRLALAAFVLWHISLMLPRIVGLEAFRRRERVRRGALR